MDLPMITPFEEVSRQSLEKMNTQRLLPLRNQCLRSKNEWMQ